MGEQSAKKRSKKKEPSKLGRFSNGLFDWAEALLASLTIVILIFTFVARLTGVAGHSMVPTLSNNDIMVVSDLGYTPARGDVVVVNKTAFEMGPIVKRVIAVGGDTVDINFATGDVTVNGQVLDEPYINERTETDEGTQFPLTVPEGSIFVLGDNRNASSDSRDPRLGCVDERYVIGKALFVLFPFDSFGKVE